MRLIGVLLLLVLAPAAANASFIYLRDDRAPIGRCFGDVESKSPELLFSPFDSGGLLIGILANQQSTLGDETMTMRGTASILTPGA